MFRFWSSLCWLVVIPATVISFNNDDAVGVEVIGAEGVRCIQQFKKDEAKAMFDIDLQQKNVNSPYLDGDQIIELPLCQDLESLDMPQGQRRREKRRIYNFNLFPKRKWQMPINFEFSELFEEDAKNKIRGSLSHFEANTCIRFREIDSGIEAQTDSYLRFSYKSSCVSFVGKATPQQGRSWQDVFLTDLCIKNFGDTVHVIAQSLGLWHEHQREDRDEYISINQDYVKDEEQASFSTISNEFLNTQGLQYDYASIMHFSGVTYKDQKAPANVYTVQTADRKNQKTIGQRTGLSFLDIKHLNLAYCSDSCAESVVCGHGGYADPNDCTKCKCKDGFSGRLCADLEPAKNAVCGGRLEASLTKLDITSPGYNFPYNSYYEPHQECTWSIKSPNGEKIKLQFKDDFALFCRDQSCYHWVEIRYGDDMEELGERFCCDERPSETFMSTGDEVMVLFRTNYTFNVQPEESVGFRLVYQVDSDDPCDYITCENGGTCNSDLGTCECRSGYRGNRCQTDLCEDNGSCLNGGTCQVASSYWAGYRCTCPPGYIGLTCQIDFCDPARMTCRNGGSCERTPRGFNCACPQGYAGSRCERVTETPCGRVTCSNGGSCYHSGSAWWCTCLDGFSGTTCDDYDPCSLNPCQNGGSCRADGGMDYVCICRPGFQGIDCDEENPDPCGSNPCLNGGSCYGVGTDGYRCLCPANYYGSTCCYYRSSCGGYGLDAGEVEPACHRDNCRRRNSILCMYCASNAHLLITYDVSKREITNAECGMKGWSRWSQCTSTCGLCGMRYRSQYDITTRYSGGTVQMRLESCNFREESCPGTPCKSRHSPTCCPGRYYNRRTCSCYK